jgi:hypothetical protein
MLEQGVDKYIFVNIRVSAIRGLIKLFLGALKALSFLYTLRKW